MFHELGVTRTTITILVAVVLSGFSGCYPAVEIRKDGSVAQHYFGYVRITQPVVEGDVQAVRITTLGVKAGRTSGVGLFDEDEVTADPDKCQVVIIIHNAREYEHALETFRKLGGQQVCGAEFTN